MEFLKDINKAIIALFSANFWNNFGAIIALSFLVLGLIFLTLFIIFVVKACKNKNLYNKTLTRYSILELDANKYLLDLKTANETLTEAQTTNIELKADLDKSYTAFKNLETDYNKMVQAYNKAQLSLSALKQSNLDGMLSADEKAIKDERAKTKAAKNKAKPIKKAHIIVKSADDKKATYMAMSIQALRKLYKERFGKNGSSQTKLELANALAAVKN